MENIDDPTVRESDHQTPDTQPGHSDPIPRRSPGMETSPGQTAAPDTPEQIALEALRNENIVRHVQRLANNPNTAAFAKSEEYVRSVARQLSAGNAPFRPQAHHVWSINCPPGTRL